MLQTGYFSVTIRSAAFTRAERSGTLSSFVFRFCARRAQKRNTDTMARTMLPAPLSLSKGRLKDVYVRYRVSPVFYRFLFFAPPGEKRPTKGKKFVRCRLSGHPEVRITHKPG